MNRFPKERLQGQRPLQPRLVLQQPLEVPQLMGQTHLAAPCWCLELRAQTITDPTLCVLLPHHFLNHFRPTTHPDEEVHPHRTPKDPLPPGPPRHTGTGLVTPNDCTLRHFRADLFGHWLGRRARPLYQRTCAPFADRDAKEVLTELRHSLVAQMLFGFEIDHRRGSAR